MHALDDEREDYDPEVARWLQDAGHRKVQEHLESAEEVLAHIEKHARQLLRTCADVDKYFHDLATKDAWRARAALKQRLIREVALLLALLFAAGAHYYLDIEMRIAGLPRIIFFL